MRSIWFRHRFACSANSRRRLPIMVLAASFAAEPRAPASRAKSARGRPADPGSLPSPVMAEAVGDLIQPRVDLHVATIRPGIVVPARIDEGVSGCSGALAGKPHGHGGGVVLVAHVDHPVVVLPAKVRLELVRAVHRPFLARIGVHEGSGLRLGDGDRRGERAPSGSSWFGIRSNRCFLCTRCPYRAPTRGRRGGGTCRPRSPPTARARRGRRSSAPGAA